MARPAGGANAAGEGAAAPNTDPHANGVEGAMKQLVPNRLNPPTARRLAGKVAIVTGAGGNVGRGITRVLCREGAAVVLANRKEEAAQATMRAVRAETRGAAMLFVKTDLLKAADIRRLIRQAVERYGRLDVLVNNSGIGFGKPLEEAAEAYYDLVMDTDLKGMWLACKHAVAHLKQAAAETGDAAIVNISSVHGHQGWGNDSGYAAAKAGIIGLTRSLAAELAASRVRANCVSPGYIPEPGWADQRVAGLPPRLRREFVERFGETLATWYHAAQPLPRQGLALDVGEAVAFFASSAALFVTGQDLLVDGALTLRPGTPGYVPVWRAEKGRQMQEWIEERTGKR
jgi:NAD(P)-dependent dehydrogenase (short-subunit alcohol dehydrogenase family)